MTDPLISPTPQLRQPLTTTDFDRLMDAYGSSKLHIINDTYSPLEKSPALCFLFPLSPQTVYLSGIKCKQ